MEDLASLSLTDRPERLIGTWRRFGPTGPVYEVLAVGAPTDAASRFMKIRVVETGEEVDYPLDAMLVDPRET